MPPPNLNLLPTPLLANVFYHSHLINNYCCLPSGRQHTILGTVSRLLVPSPLAELCKVELKSRFVQFLLEMFVSWIAQSMKTPKVRMTIY